MHGGRIHWRRDSVSVFMLSPFARDPSRRRTGGSNPRGPSDLGRGYKGDTHAQKSEESEVGRRVSRKEFIPRSPRWALAPLADHRQAAAQSRGGCAPAWFLLLPGPRG